MFCILAQAEYVTIARNFQSVCRKEVDNIVGEKKCNTYRRKR
jgi:hypothetical protein